jgi:hypothetical protein
MSRSHLLANALANAKSMRTYRHETSEKNKDTSPRDLLRCHLNLHRDGNGHGSQVCGGQASR